MRFFFSSSVSPLWPGRPSLPSLFFSLVVLATHLALLHHVCCYCVVEFVVTETGATRDPVPIECKPRGMFEKSSVKAALKLKYKPRVVDGNPAEVAGVQKMFTYKLEE